MTLREETQARLFLLGILIAGSGVYLAAGLPGILIYVGAWTVCLAHGLGGAKSAPFDARRPQHSTTTHRERRR